MTAPNEKLRRRVYNVTAMSFTPEELASEISKHIPQLTISYKPDTRQLIGECIHIFISFNKLKILFMEIFK